MIARWLDTMSLYFLINSLLWVWFKFFSFVVLMPFALNICMYLYILPKLLFNIGVWMYVCLSSQIFSFSFGYSSFMVWVLCNQWFLFLFLQIFILFLCKNKIFSFYLTLFIFWCRTFFLSFYIKIIYIYILTYIHMEDCIFICI